MFGRLVVYYRLWQMGKQTFTSINGPIALFRGHTEQSNTRSQYCINLTVTTVKSITVELIPPQDGRPLGMCALLRLCPLFQVSKAQLTD
ncbi:unnamed protein product [Fusarium graminearum]|nr:unnamed protein product [Fusarium graminearum]